MKPKHDAFFLYQMFDAAQKIQAVLKDMDYPEFVLHREKQGALFWNFQVLGGSAKQISEEITRRHPEIKWSFWAGFEDEMLEHCLDVHDDIIWAAAKIEVPKLLSQLELVPELTEVLKNQALTKKEKNDDHLPPQGKEGRTQLDGIMARRELIYQSARRHKVKKVFVFGSCARREEGPESDIDFLVEFESGVTFRDYVEFEEELEKLFERKIDLVSTEGLHFLIRDDVLKEAVEI